MWRGIMFHYVSDPRKASAGASMEMRRRAGVGENLNKIGVSYVV